MSHRRVGRRRRAGDGRRLEFIFYPDSKLYDGRFANNGWLQEMPDPMTKLTWDNAALMSPATAEKLGVAHEDVVKLKFKGREVEAPVYVMPGQADGTVAVSLGYGRTAAGKVGGSAADGIEPVGFDAYKLRTSDAMWFGTGLTVEPTGKKHRFATTHDRYWIDKVGFEGRAERIGELVREATLEEYRKQRFSPLPWERGRGEGDGQWHAGSTALTLTLSRRERGPMTLPKPRSGRSPNTTGPPLGHDHRPIKMRRLRGVRRWPARPRTTCPWWARSRCSAAARCTGCGSTAISRASRPTAKVVFQPLPCQQCEMAPCEQVCPVGATVHSKEGLNDMAYNRCIGVRYCANNCPFKVRRFNFFNYHKDLEDPANEVLKMVVQSASDGPLPRRDGEVHLLRAADSGRQDRGQEPPPGDDRRRPDQDRLPAGVSHGRPSSSAI